MAKKKVKKSWEVHENLPPFVSFDIKHEGFKFRLYQSGSWGTLKQWALEVIPPAPVKVTDENGASISGEEVAKKRAFKMIEDMLRKLRSELIVE